MQIFDYSFLRNGLIPARLVNLAAAIASLKTMAALPKEAFPQAFAKLQAIAKVQSVKSSTRALMWRKTKKRKALSYLPKAGVCAIILQKQRFSELGRRMALCKDADRASAAPWKVW